MVALYTRDDRSFLARTYDLDLTAVVATVGPVAWDGFPDGVIGLTGTPEQTAQVAKAYRAFYQKVGEGEGYTMNHSLTVYLMGPDGQFRSAVAHDLGPDKTAKLIESVMARG